MPKLAHNKTQINAAINSDIVKQFRAVCRNERRCMNAQLEVVLEEWLKNKPVSIKTEKAA